MLMQSSRETLLCHYHYDPLDQLTASSPAKQATTQRFYLKDRLATEIQGTTQRSIIQHDDQLVAQQQRQNSNVETRLLATDQQRSVLNALDSNRPHPLAFPPYGHCAPQYGLLSLLSFNGERPDPITGHYLLGKGYRAFNPVLMRFNSPDSWSPFGEGGLNAYAYCIGDPVNRLDPSGHSSLAIWLLKYFPATVATTNKTDSLIKLSKQSKSLTSSTPANTARSTRSASRARPTQNANAAKAHNVSNKKNNPLLTRNQTAPNPTNVEMPASWTYSKSGAAFKKSGLTKSAQDTFDAFQNAIKNTGASPSEAARLAGETKLKKLTNAKIETWQIRLSGSERATFLIEDRMVKVLQVGGHT